MIHRLRFANFHSFEEEAELSFLQDGRASSNDLSAQSAVSERRLNKVVAVFGPNASGKTNLIRPLSFLAGFIASSFSAGVDDPLPFEPHFFSEKLFRGEPEADFRLEFEASVGGKIRLYQYSLRATQKRVLEEQLEVKTSSRFSNVFHRLWDSETESYSVQQKGFGLRAQQATAVRPNASLISTAAQFNVAMAMDLVTYFGLYETNLGDYKARQMGPIVSSLMISKFYSENERYRNKMVSLLKNWDIGLSDIVVEEERLALTPGTEPSVWYVPYGIHARGSKRARLPLMHESSGTQSAYVLLAHLLPALERGGVAIIDEIESDLHPLMIEPILDLFFSPNTNPNNAQLVFTSHTIEVMNLLQKAQIMLVEKDELSRSSTWSLADMNARADDNFYAKYLAGAYGAVPSI